MKKIISVFLLVASMHASMLKTSYYSKYHQGRMTSSGVKYDMYKLTCAHKKYPFGTTLLVSNPQNGKSVIVTVTDRGPFVRGRQLDLSYRAASRINLTKYGVLMTKVVVIKLGNGKLRHKA